MIKIGDFGLVVSAEQQIYGLNNINSKKMKSNDGTFLYMSPEQVSYKTEPCINHYSLVTTIILNETRPNCFNTFFYLIILIVEWIGL
jgi:hypothetical protein